MNRIAIGALFLGIACAQHSDPCFTPPSKVEDLRILGIAVDPPDPVADLASGIVDSVRLKALIGDETGSDGTHDVTWSLCVASIDNPGCAGGTVIARNPEWKRDSSLEVRVPKDLIAAAVAADPVHGFAGMRVLAELRVSGANPPTATTPIVFSPAAPPQRNHPPEIQGLRILPQGSDPRGAAPAPQSTSVFVAQPTGLRPLLVPGAAEEYDTVDFSGRTVHVQERIRYSFYVTPGLNVGRILLRSFGPSIVSFANGSDVEADEPAPGTPESPGGLMLFEAVLRGGGPGTLWIIARDSRGATSWLEVPVTAIEVDPNCLVPPGPLRRNCDQLDFGCF